MGGEIAPRNTSKPQSLVPIGETGALASQPDVLGNNGILNLEEYLLLVFDYPHVRSVGSIAIETPRYWAGDTGSKFETPICPLLLEDERIPRIPW